MNNSMDSKELIARNKSKEHEGTTARKDKIQIATTANDGRSSDTEERQQGTTARNDSWSKELNSFKQMCLSFRSCSHMAHALHKDDAGPRGVASV